MGETVTIDGREYDWDTLVHYMDNTVREGVHMDLAPCSNEAFAEEYAARHAATFGESWFPEQM